MANPTFTEAFSTIGTSVSEYMVTEYNEGRLRDTNYATVQAQAVNAIIQGALTMSMNTDTQAAQTALVTAQKALVDAQTANVIKDGLVKEYQLTTLLPDEHSKNQGHITLLAKQATQQDAETAYTNARKEIALSSRIDNLLIEDLKAQQNQLATIGAGGLVPSTNDFSNANLLRQAVYDRAKNGATVDTGGTLPIVTFTAGTTYTKAT